MERKKAKEVLSEMSFDLLKGEIFGLFGVNGAGKAILFLSLLVLTIQLREILWKDKSIYEDLIQYLRIIGFCP